MDDRTTAKTIGERARASRTALGLNQAEVAEQVGMSAEVYGRLERGAMLPRVPTLLRLCEVLRVTPNGLLAAEVPTAEPARKSPPELRRLLALMERAAPGTVRRVLTVARWLGESKTSPPSRRPRRAKPLRRR